MSDRSSEVSEPGEERGQFGEHSVESWDSFPTQTFREDDRGDIAVTQSMRTQAMVKTESNQGESPNSDPNARLGSPSSEDLTPGAPDSATTTLFYSATPTPSGNEDRTSNAGEKQGEW